jgi:hypothetical protein
MRHAGWRSEVGIAMKMGFNRRLRDVYLVCVYLRVLCFRLVSRTHIASALSSFLSQLLLISSSAATRPVEMNLVVRVGSLHRLHLRAQALALR